MSLLTIRQALLWCTVINYVILLLWWAIILLKWEWMYDLWTKWFRVSREKVDSVNFVGIVFYKVAIILFNLAPLIALYIVNPSS